MALSGSASAEGAASVKVLDKTFDVGAGMFAYTEYELSGEPLAEGLGLDLDVLDPDQADKPDPFDFAAGIDSYEYSEEAMYAVNYQSTLGPHLVNGPVNAKRGRHAPRPRQGFIALAECRRLLARRTAAEHVPDHLPARQRRARVRPEGRRDAGVDLRDRRDDARGQGREDQGA